MQGAACCRTHPCAMPSVDVRARPHPAGYCSAAPVRRSGSGAQGTFPRSLFLCWLDPGFALYRGCWMELRSSRKGVVQTLSLRMFIGSSCCSCLDATHLCAPTMPFGLSCVFMICLNCVADFSSFSKSFTNCLLNVYASTASSLQTCEWRWRLLGGYALKTYMGN